MNKPPLQHQRPMTTDKNRVHISGIKQLQGQQEGNYPPRTRM